VRENWGKPTIAVILSAILFTAGVLLYRPTVATADDSVSTANEPTASSETAQTNEISALQEQIERSGQAYDDANAHLEQLEAQIADNQTRLGELEQALPLQQEQCDEAIVTLYKYRSDYSTFVDMFFSSSSFSEVLQVFEYFDHLNETNIATIENTESMKSELEATQNQLEADRVTVEQEKDNAAQALAEAQASREEAQRKAEEAAAAQLAARQAAEQAAAQQAAAQQATASTATDSAATASAAATSDSAATTGGSASEDPTPVSGSVNTGAVDWSQDKTAFVANWGPRIDNYLEGSNLAGYGTLFASSAYDYGVDPRWSPAISYTESGKGAVCFRAYNAWGWGHSSYSSWEESIPAHVAYLGRVYGGYLTLEGAELYSGMSNYVEWYNIVCDQMAQI